MAPEIMPSTIIKNWISPNIPEPPIEVRIWSNDGFSDAEISKFVLFGDCSEKV